MRWIGQITYDEVAYFREDVIIEAGNKLGIGTTSPAAALHVYGTTGIVSESPSNASITIRRNDNTNYGALLKYHTGNSEKWVAGLSDAGDFTDSTGVEYFIGTSKTAPKFLINSSGNVGIGTSSPQKTLDVAGGDIRLDNSKGIYFSTVDANIGRVSITGDESNDFIRLKVDNNNSHVINLNTTGVGVGTTSPASKLHVAGTVQVGVDDAGHDVTFYGDASGEYMQWDTSEAKLKIVHTDEAVGLEVYTNASAQTTEPQLKVGRNVNEWWGAYCTDRTAHLVHRQDETSGSPNTSFEIWDSNTTDSAAYWVWRHADGSGGSLTEKMRLTKAGVLSVAELDISGNIDIDGITNLDAVDIDGAVQIDNTLTVGVDDTGHDVKFFGATSGRYLLWDESEDTLKLQDTTQLKFGDGGDMSIYHTSGQNWIDAYSGQLNIRQLDNDADITFQSDDGSGGLATYLTLDGSATNMKAYKDMRFIDNVDVEFGDSGDFKIYHDGSNTYLEQINAGTGNIVISNANDDADIIFQSDDGSGSTTEYFRLDGGVTEIIVSKKMQFGDDVKAVFGAGEDLDIFHDGTNSTINNAVGNLILSNDADDGDIIFKSDNGSGGLAAYLTLDGGLGYTTAQKNIRFADDIKAEFGNDGDLKIDHDSSGYGYVQNMTGHLYLANYADDGDIIFQSDNGAGGTATYFSLDGSLAAHDGSATTGLFTKWGDNSKIVVGNGADGRFYHNATNTYLENTNGDLYIQNKADDKDIIFQSDDGSGGIETYFFLDGSASSGNPITQFPDLSQLVFGNSQDLLLRHDGTDSLIQNNGGDFIISQHTNDKDLIFKCDDGSGGVGEYFRLDGSQSDSGSDYRYTRWQDYSVVALGAGNDLQLWHNSTDSKIQNYTGHLYIRNNADDKDIIFQCDDGSGGAETYLTLDGSTTRITSHVDFDFADHAVFANNTELRWKDSGGTERTTLELTSADDLYFGGSFSGSTIFVGGGSYTERMRIDDSGGVLLSSTLTVGVDDTGHDVKFFGATSGKYLLWDESQDRLEFTDATYAAFGTDGDMLVYHTGTDGFITEKTGHLYIRTQADDKDIIFQSDDGSGGTTAYLTLDGSATTTVFAKNTRIEDSVLHQFGGGNDMAIYHNGTDSFITNDTGDLRIRQFANDKDIIFDCDDGSGGVETYFFLDGSANSGSNAYTVFPDTSVLAFGGDRDLKIYHDTTNTFLKNETGDLYIRNTADDKDIIFQSDDGSGGVATYLTLDGGFSVPYVALEDSAILALGTHKDLLLTHDGTDSKIDNMNTGDLKIRNFADDKDIILMSDDGSGGVTAYLTLDGSAGFTRSNKEFRMDDNVKFQAGTGGDLDIYHSGSHAVIDNATGNFTIQNSTDDGDIIFKSDDGSGGVATYLTLDGSAGHTTVQKEMNFGDNIEATFGASNDLKVYHSGSHSYMIQRGTGNLYIQQTTNDADITFTCDDGSGGNTPYLTLDGRNEEVVFYKPIVTAETQIKVLPHQFMSNEDGGANKSAQFRDDTIIGVRSTADDSELYAFVEIPYGKTATNVTVYGNDASLAVNVYESDINAGALTDKTPGAGCVVGDVCDITDVAYSATNYLVIKVTTVSYTNDIVYGAVVTIT